MDKMASGQNGKWTKWQVDNCTKWLVDKMAIRQSDRLAKWQDD